MKKLVLIVALISLSISTVIYYGEKDKTIFKIRNINFTNEISYFVAPLPFPITWRMEVAAITILSILSAIVVFKLKHLNKMLNNKLNLSPNYTNFLKNVNS